MAQIHLTGLIGVIYLLVLVFAFPDALSKWRLMSIFHTLPNQPALLTGISKAHGFENHFHLNWNRCLFFRIEIFMLKTINCMMSGRYAMNIRWKSINFSSSLISLLLLNKHQTHQTADAPKELIQALNFTIVSLPLQKKCALKIRRKTVQTNDKKKFYANKW